MASATATAAEATTRRSLRIRGTAAPVQVVDAVQWMTGSTRTRPTVARGHGGCRWSRRGWFVVRVAALAVARSWSTASSWAASSGRRSAGISAIRTASRLEATEHVVRNTGRPRGSCPGSMTPLRSTTHVAPGRHEGFERDGQRKSAPPASAVAISPAHVLGAHVRRHPPHRFDGRGCRLGACALRLRAFLGVGHRVSSAPLYRVTVIESGADYRVLRFQSLRGTKRERH